MYFTYPSLTIITYKIFLIKTFYTDNIIKDWQFEANPGSLRQILA